ncbi:MAG: murein biosynthesis integral membrane protein MurJ [Clostridiales bacterium]|jgi:putative peptidoglycan lipid II flippase|nr:murein biosynthesis integral membrane protein MurJ [Clostridiales bacterium]
MPGTGAGRGGGDGGRGRERDGNGGGNRGSGRADGVAAPGRRLAVNASIVMCATIASRVTGFFREMLIPAKFGVGYVADVYDVAFKFPDLMFSLLIGGAISAALVPVLSGSISLGGGDEREGWESVSRFMNLTMALTLVVCAVGAVFAERLVVLFAQGWDPAVPEDLQKIVMAARLTRVLFPSVAFLMLAGFANSVLYAYQRFAAAAFGPVLYNVLCIASIAFLSGGDAGDYYHVDRVVYGVMLSSFAYFIFQTANAWKNIRGRFVFRLDARHKGFLRLFRIAVPSLVSSSVIQVNTMISASFSSRFEAGSIIALRMADRTWQMPFGIIAQSMGIALLPNLSGKIANGDLAGYRKLLLQGLRVVLLLAVPTAAACVVLNRLIMRTLFLNSARTTEADVALTASILACYSIALVTQSINTILTRAFYACNETKTPMITGLSIIGLNILLSVLFYFFTPVGVKGMALAYSASSFVNALLLVTLLNRRLPGLNVFSGMGGFFAKIFGAALAMAALLALLGAFVPEVWVAGPVGPALKIRQLLVLFGNAVVGACAYFSLLLCLRVPEVVRLFERVVKINKFDK